MTLKIDQMLFLTAGLLLTGHAILTPLLMVIVMTAGDFLAMSATTDNVRPSPKPNAWRIDNLTIAGIVLSSGNLFFCGAILALGHYWLGLDLKTLRTLAAVVMVFSGQALFYAVRERRHLWSSWPSRWIMLSSVADILIISVLATNGILMTRLPLALVAAVLLAAVAFSFVLDGFRVAIFKHLKMA